MKSGAPQLGMSDRLNAVLVRDVQQMLNGRAFLAVLLLSLGIGAKSLEDTGVQVGNAALRSGILGLLKP